MEGSPFGGSPSLRKEHMQYIFNPPTVEETPAGFGALFWRFRIPRADTITMTNGVVSSQRTYEISELLAADYYYVGGHVYTLSKTEYTQLVAAGYGSYITTVA